MLPKFLNLTIDPWLTKNLDIHFNYFIKIQGTIFNTMYVRN